MNGPYDDIIHLPHPVSANRPQMPLADRAAQFSPFAALTGHGAAIKETAMLTDQRIDLGEDSKAMLDMKLNLLIDQIAGHPEVAVTYFQPDRNKSGGGYSTVTGALKKIDDYEHVIVLMDGTNILVADTIEIESELFRSLL